MENLQYWPQITTIGMSLASIGFEIYQHDKTRYWKPIDLKSILMMGLQLTCLYYGGFVKISIPFLLYCILIVVGLASVYRDIGKEKSKKLWPGLVAIVLIHTLYYYGGFYDVFK